ncbi:hypothetical protein LWC35_10235 [Pseudonocardia kujensis]|uniref:hypothetical protein n=1 Tax=Pseudonocardia kujensis TaxID=1128675 RepID=UPI001E447666|nr:hypothetical protein [Pseudonocardia kujensis]MCE0763281.1 hypothetical protein [Pseudonocardia kujensis]
MSTTAWSQRSSVLHQTFLLPSGHTKALAENLSSTIKIELLYWPGTTFATRREPEHALIRYLDGRYNPRRIQAKLGEL